MKKILTFLTAVTFASTALFAEAAVPRAAEDPGAPVVTNDAPVPKVRKVTPKAKKASNKRVAKASKSKKKIRVARH